MSGLRQPVAAPARGAVAALRWAALGDSFTAGIAPGEMTWPRLVEMQISPSRIALANLATAGARTEELERIQLPSALALEPKLVSLICGANDVIRSVRPDLNSLRRRLDRIHRRLAEELPAAGVLTATYPAIASGSFRLRTRRRIEGGLRELNSIIREAAARHGARCVELAAHPGRVDLSNYANDGIHPSGAGHRAAAEVLGAAIEELIEAKRKETR